MTRFLLAAGFSLLGLATALTAAEPKRLLVVSATAGTRHASIPNGEKMIRDLAAKSNGQFTVTMMSDAADYPFSRVPGGGRGAIPGFAGQIPTAAMAQQDALFLASGQLGALMTAATTARTELTTASINQPSAIQARADALATAETNLALARATAIAQAQATAGRLTLEQLQALSGPGAAAAAGGRGGAAGARGGAGAVAAPDNTAVLARLFQEHLSAASLARYDGILFLSSSGALPFPDRDAFLKWVSDGHAVVGLHAAMDTTYYTPDNHMEMLSGGSRYASSPGGSATARKIYRVDAAHPATRDWPDGLSVVDEFYQFHHVSPRDINVSIPGIDRSKVHSLLDVDYEGQRLAVAWTRMHGRGRVFYTSLGHRDDVLLAGVPLADGGARVNPDAVAAAYQAHVLNGIRWALNLTP